MILVTGARGFVGRSLLRALENSARPGRAYDGHVRDILTLRQQMQGVETVVHLASAERRGRAAELHSTDVEGTRTVLQEAERANVNHLIYISKIGADPSSMFAVFRTKGEVERMVQASKIPTTILRSATLFGRDDYFINTLAGLAVWSWPLVWLPDGGHSLLQPLWVEDLVRCILLVSDPLDLKGYRGHTFTVAGEERLRFEELMHLILSAAGLTRRPVAVRMMVVRGVIKLLFRAQERPTLTNFFLDRLILPETAPFHVVYRAFGFHPSRLNQHLTHLRHPAVGWRLSGPRY